MLAQFIEVYGYSFMDTLIKVSQQYFNKAEIWTLTGLLQHLDISFTATLLEIC